MIDSEDDFHVMRKRLLDKPTLAEYALRKRLESTIETMDTDDKENKPPISNTAKPSKWDRQLIIHYTHESRLASYKADLHRIWNNLFRGTSVALTRFIVGNKNSPNATKQLMRRRPKPNPSKMETPK